MKLHFEEEHETERQKCSDLARNLEGTAMNCLVAKKTTPVRYCKNHLDTAEPLWLESARAPSDDALGKTKAR